ncbi:MAG: hypothetical protein A2W28_13040 [Gammaproteobacteria bacterium RBG_16_51_14]|nr:MAG: hypothetical protein A2W28_13040 [Gammaproteobacteria bacterium RBG_16_51_14]
MGVAGTGDDARQGRLARARRPPEHHGMQAAIFNGQPQGFVLAKDMLLPDKIIKALWPHPIRQRIGRVRGQSKNSQRIRGRSDLFLTSK